VLDRYFTRVAILPTFVVMLGVFGMPLAFSFYLSFTGYGLRRVVAAFDL
jgi:multiple sugar transport system permease protein